MVPEHVRRPVLVAARDQEWAALTRAFAADRLRGWEARQATDFPQAQFLLQHGACDVLLLDGVSFPGQEGEALARLAARRKVPVVVLAGCETPGTAEDGEEDGNLRLPRDLALDHPALLDEALRAADRCRRLRGDLDRAAEEVREWRQRADRLAALLWEAAPADGHGQWCSQRSLMGRLQEELARAERRQGSFSVVVGDVPADPDPAARTGVVDRITQGKRRSDVAGQYGPYGFLLLLPDTGDAGAVACCRRLQGLLRRHPADTSAGPGPASPHVAFGIASYPAAGSATGLLSRAEERLQEARGAARG
jgi:GGDEF domain-containing protein